MELKKLVDDVNELKQYLERYLIVDEIIVIFGLNGVFFKAVKDEKFYSCVASLTEIAYSGPEKLIEHIIANFRQEFDK